jgi:hypothetical protein
MHSMHLSAFKSSIGETSISASTYFFGCLSRGVTVIACRFLRRLQGCCLLEFLRDATSFRRLSLVRCLFREFSFARSLRG